MKKINPNDETKTAANKALGAIWGEQQINAMKDLMDMNEDYCCLNDILEDIDEFNPYVEN